MKGSSNKILASTTGTDPQAAAKEAATNLQNNLAMDLKHANQADVIGNASGLSAEDISGSSAKKRKTGSGLASSLGVQY